MASGWKRHLVPSLLLVAGTGVAFYQVVWFDFVNFDDPVYVTQNFGVQGGLSLETVRWAFSETGRQGHWHPLTWLSLALDFETYGLDPRGFHLTNLLLHIANTLLVYQVLVQSTGAEWRSATVAALFGWHPLHVESVAWITERKDVLSTLFWLATMLAYIGYAHRSTWRRYGLVVLFFVLGLLAKPMLVTLPIMLMLWDYWPLRREVGWKWVLVEKVPLLGLAAASSLWTLTVMRAGTVRPLGEALTPITRLNNALTAYTTYLSKMVWPVGLVPYYPIDPGATQDFDALLPALFLGGCTLLAVVFVKHRPYLFVGWLWYVVTLAPVSGRWQAGSYTWADRYTYVPLFGIFVALVWLAHDVLRGRWPRKLLILATGTILLACLAKTWLHVGIWENSESLWLHTLAVTPNNYLAHVNLAIEFERQGRVHKALAHLQKAVEIYPQYAPGLRRLAQTYQRYQFIEETETTLRKLIELRPEEPDFRLDLATFLRRFGRVKEAEEQEEAVSRLHRLKKSG